MRKIHESGRGATEVFCKLIRHKGMKLNILRKSDRGRMIFDDFGRNVSRR